jgi:pyruvate/2-oxoacid:ferredoxin oxidoreductase alpha subunit/NAD-dependent dihydropyrimidine dehydrogenase PreA subunit
MSAIGKWRPVVALDYCKGCGRCIDSCAQRCISAGTAIHSSTGLVPIQIDLERCTACGLCFDACPEPYGLRPDGRAETHAASIAPEAVDDRRLPLPASEPLVIKGMYASAIGALLAGCRHFFGYPITPSTEGAELMAKVLPRLDGHFVQATSEVAAINMLYGAAAGGARAMTFTSSPGFSLMLEGLSYMIGAELPGVIVDVMRGGPGLGNIGPEQSDIKLVCRGLGHGHTHAIVLAPSTPQEMLDLTAAAFDLAFAYRSPVILAADGYLGQITGKVRLPLEMVKPGIPKWAVAGDTAYRGNLVASIHLSEAELEALNERLIEKYRRIAAVEQRADLVACDDADTILVACNTPARMAKAAVQTLRARNLKVGLFRPVTLWPFPIALMAPLLPQASRLIVVEASPGQLEDELRLALSHAELAAPPIEHVRRFGGFLPSHDEIVARVLQADDHVPRGAAA